MKTILLAIAATLFVAGPIDSSPKPSILRAAADPTVKLPAEVRTKPGRLLKLSAETDGKTVRWAIASEDADLIPSESGRWAIFSAPAPGRFIVLAWTAAGDVPSEAARCIVVVGDAPPGPAPGPAPIPVDGFRVLIVYETADLPKMPAAQVNILYSQSVRSYLNDKCVLGPDGKTREWRIWDKDVATGAESKFWQDAMKLPRKQVPWIVISTGKSGFEGPLPGSVDETLALVRRYGG